MEGAVYTFLLCTGEAYAPYSTPNLYHYQPHPLAEAHLPVFSFVHIFLGWSGSGCCGALCLVVVRLIIFSAFVCTREEEGIDFKKKNTRNGFVF